MYLGEKQSTKWTKHGWGKLHSIETEIDAQACNVSYEPFKVQINSYKAYEGGSLHRVKRNPIKS